MADAMGDNKDPSAMAVATTSPTGAIDSKKGNDEVINDSDDIAEAECGPFFLSLPPADWRATLCGLSADLSDPSAEDNGVVWDVDLLQEANVMEDCRVRARQ